LGRGGAILWHGVGEEMDGGDMGRAEAHGVQRLQQGRRPERRVDGHEAPAQDGSKACKHEQSCRAAKGNDPLAPAN